MQAAFAFRFSARRDVHDLKLADRQPAVPCRSWRWICRQWGQLQCCNRGSQEVISDILNCVCPDCGGSMVNLAESSSAGENVRRIGVRSGATLVRRIPPSVMKAITLSW